MVYIGGSVDIDFELHLLAQNNEQSILFYVRIFAPPFIYLRERNVVLHNFVHTTYNER